MNPTEGILYLIDGTVKCAEREKPEKPNIYKPKKLRFDKAMKIYRKALKSWEADCKDVVNAHVSQHPIEGHDEITILKPVFQMAESGQKCLFIPEGEKVRITQLL